MKRKKLGEILQDRGHISAGDLQQLFKEQEGKMVRLGELILERGLVDKPTLVKALEEVSRVPYLDCSTIQCQDAVLQSIPKPMAVRLDILPVRLEQSRLIVVMAEPQNVATINELRFTCGKDISPRFGFRAEIQSAIVRSYDHFVSSAPLRQAVNEAPLESGIRDGVHFHQFPPGQSGSHSGNSSGTQPEKNARGPPGVGNHKKGHGQAGQRHSH